MEYSHGNVVFSYEPRVIFEADDRWTYAREPVFRRMPDGSFVCLHYAGGPREPHDDNVVLITRSEDDGDTWTAPEVLFEHPHRGCWCTELFVEDGTPCAFVHTLEAASRYADLHTYRSWTHDNGQTWTEPTSVPGGPCHVSMRQGIVLGDGTWLFPVYWQEILSGFAWERDPDARSPLEPAAWPFRCGVLRSTDGGESFTQHGYIRHPEVMLWEPNVAELRDGRLLMLMRAENTGALWRSDSCDGGLTWSAAHPTDISNPSTKLTLLAHEGALILLNNPNPVKGERKPLELWVSHDDGATWPTRLTLADVPEGRGVFYPHGHIEAERGILYVACETGRVHYLLKIPLADFL